LRKATEVSQKRMSSTTDPQRGRRGARGDPSAFADQVLAIVERVPRGSVVTYGDVARMLGTRSPRSVGQVLSRWGEEVSWWRVVRADGTPPPGHSTVALQRLVRERVPLLPGRTAVDLNRARWKGARGTDPRRGGSRTS
jgi:alkylated DNA nucleotide flippase Atl1